MEWIAFVYLVGVSVTVVTVVVLAIFACQRRNIPGATPFALAMVTIAQSATMYFLQALTVNPDLAFIWTKLRFIGLAFAPVLYLIFILHYTGRKEWVVGKRLILLWAIPGLTQLIVWVAPVGLFFQHWSLVRIGTISLEDSQFTGWFWIHFLYSNTVLLCAVIWLAYYALRIDSSATKGARWIIIGIVIGTLGAVPGLTLGPKPGLRFTPIGLGLMGLAAALALLRFRLFDIIPIAYDAIFRGMQDAAVVIDAQMRIIQVNAAAQRLLLSGSPELLGKEIHQIIKTDARIADLLTHESVQMELPIPHAESSSTYEVHLSPLYCRRNLVGHLIVLRDITARKQAEAQRIQLELEKERVLALHNLIGNATHDLMTPLSIISTSLHLARKVQDDETRTKQFEKIEHQTRRLENMLKDMLSLSELDVMVAQHLVYHELNVHELVSTLFVQFCVQARGKGQVLSLNCPYDLLRLPVNAEDLYTALAQLLDNAIKYSGPNSTIQVTVQQTANQITIAVNDTGPGIPAADLPHVFERFYRAQMHRPTDSGTGLGLSIAQRLIELHGGQIMAQSVLRQGSTFTICLPGFQVT